MKYWQGIVVCISFLLFTLGGFFCAYTPVYAITNVENATITLQYDGKSYSYNFLENLPTVNNFLDMRKLQRNNRLGTSVERAKKIKEINLLGFDLIDAFEYMFFGWRDFYEDIKQGIECEPRDADLQFNPRKSPYFFITPSRTGYAINDELLLNNILAKLEQSNNVVVNIEPDILLPKIVESELKQYTTKLSQFSTNYEKSNSDRKHNVRTALEKFNGMRIEAGEVVSFNDTTGRRTQQNGYREAKIIQDKKYVEAYGGGVCQSSTTLYNALVLAGIKILEVHPHSLPPSYVDLAFDAMVNFGTSDLKFQNDTGAPIFLRTFYTDKIVVVEVYGKKVNNYTIKRVSEVVAKIEPEPDKEIIDKTGEYTDKVKYKDEYFYKVLPKAGYKAKGYLEYYQDGRLLNKKLIRNVTYHSVQGVKIWGARERPPEPIVESIEQENENSLGQFWSTLDNLLAKNN